jgi:hypothetical protein
MDIMLLLIIIALLLGLINTFSLIYIYKEKIKKWIYRHWKKIAFIGVTTAVITGGANIIFDVPEAGGQVFGNNTAAGGNQAIHSSAAGGTCFLLGVRGKPTAGNGYVNNMSVKFTNLASTETYQCALYEYTDNSSAYAGNLVTNGITDTVEVTDTEDNTIVVFDFSTEPYVTNDTWYYLCVKATTENSADALNQITAQRFAGTYSGLSKSSTDVLSYDNPLTGESGKDSQFYIYAQYTPFNNTAPTQNTPNPANDTIFVDLQLDNYYDNFNITVADVDDSMQDMDVYFRADINGTWETIGTNLTVNNGTYRCDNVSWVCAYDTEYTWSVNVSDKSIGGAAWSNATYTFKTEHSYHTPYKWDNITLTNQQFGCNFTNRKILNWSFIEANLEYKLFYNNTDNTSELIPLYNETHNDTNYGFYRDYHYTMCIDDSAVNWDFYLYFNSHADTVTHDTTNKTIIFNYTDYEIFYDYTDIFGDPAWTLEVDTTNDDVMVINCNDTTEAEFTCVDIDPMFGFTGALGTNIPISGGGGSPFSRLFIFRDQCVTPTDDPYFTDYFNVTFDVLNVGNDYQCALYSDDAGSVGTKLVESVESYVGSSQDFTTQQFDILQGDRIQLTNNSYYWLAVRLSSGSLSTNYLAYTYNSPDMKQKECAAGYCTFDNTLSGLTNRDGHVAVACYFDTEDILSTEVDDISPYWHNDISSLQVNVTNLGSPTPDKVNLWYRWSTDNATWDVESGDWSNQTIENNACNEDGQASKGQESNFVNCQDFSDGDYMTLVEQDYPSGVVNEDLDVDGYTATSTRWSKTAPEPYLNSDGSGNIYTDKNGRLDRWYTFADTSETGSGYEAIIYVDFDGSDGVADVEYYVEWNGDDTPEYVGTFTNPTTTVMNTGVIAGLDTATEINAARIGFKRIGSGTPATIIDYAYINITKSATNYELDLEYNWTTANFSREIKTICIDVHSHTGGIEPLLLMYWNTVTSGWVLLDNDIDTGWNNITVSGMIDATYGIRLVDSDNTSDGTQDTWNIDCIYLQGYNSTEGDEIGCNWRYWGNDTTEPYEYTFNFPNETGYYEFYSIAEKSGYSDESAPSIADAICHVNISDDMPIIVIMYAGNESDWGGSFYIPSLENDTDTLCQEPYCPHGYFTNNSKQIENTITVKANITNNESSDTIEVCYYNYDKSGWTNKTMVYNATSTYWENTTTFTGIYEDTFTLDIKITRGITEYIQHWYKKGGSDCRNVTRTVILACNATNISMTPLYHYEATVISSYPDGDRWKVENNTYPWDCIMHDQGWAETLNDTSLIRKELPEEDMEETFCGTWVGGWYHNNTPVENFTLSNIRVHFWVSSLDFTTGNSRIGFDKARGKAVYSCEEGTGNNFTIDASDAKSSIIYNNSIIHQFKYLNETYILIDKVFTLNQSFQFCDNDMYEFSYFFYSAGENPSIICNRSVISCIWFNIPNNATLNQTDTDNDGLNDYEETWITYTSINLSDTDNDGVNDYDEYLQGSDPNNYLDSTGTISTTIRNDGIDYFVWCGQNLSAWHVKQEISGFDEATEYIGIWNNGTWNDIDANWDYYYGDESGTNFSITVFDIIQVYLTDSGTQEISMNTVSGMDYTASYTYTWVNTSINKGYNYTGYNKVASTNLSNINDSVTLQAGEAIALWNETTFTWNWYLPEFDETDVIVHRWDIIISKVEDTEVWNT